MATSRQDQPTWYPFLFWSGLIVAFLMVASLWLPWYSWDNTNFNAFGGTVGQGRWKADPDGPIYEADLFFIGGILLFNLLAAIWVFGGSRRLRRVIAPLALLWSGWGVIYEVTRFGAGYVQLEFGGIAIIGLMTLNILINLVWLVWSPTLRLAGNKYT